VFKARIGYAARIAMVAAILTLAGACASSKSPRDMSTPSTTVTVPVTISTSAEAKVEQAAEVAAPQVASANAHVDAVRPPQPEVTISTASAASASVVVAPPAKEEDPALAFLHRAEARNASTKSLSATFSQTRVDNAFLDEVTSEGEFWYREPAQFRASYKDENSSELWMVDGRIIVYVPEIAQVDIITPRQGNRAPIHQMLLGFGTRVEQILSVFDVSMAPEQRPGLLGIEFESRDLARSLEMERITIYFDEERAEPRVIVAQADDSTITIDLKSIKFNPSINDAVFEPSWPDSAFVIEHGN
jgi:outer membrane lipoprotein-sorting protein